MKRYIPLLLLAAFLVLLAVACSPEVEASKQEINEDAIEIKNGSVTDLTTFEDGEEKVYQLAAGESGNAEFHFTGATIDSLYVIEPIPEGAEGSKGGYTWYDGVDWLPYVIVPQPNGEVSISGSKFGLSASGLFKIKKLDSGAKLATNNNGDNYFQYDIDKTRWNYRTEGLHEYFWPRYMNYYVVDLNDSSGKWERYKDQKVVIMQDIVNYSNEGDIEISHRFGLADPGRILYNEDVSINGLYDLNGRDHVYLYSYMENAYTGSDGFGFETYLLLPKEICLGKELEVNDIPLAVVFRDDDFSPENSYVISLNGFQANRDRNVLHELIRTLLYSPVAVGDNNGRDLPARIHVQNVTKNEDGTANADVLISNISEDFVEKFWIVDRSFDEGKPEVFGAISFRKANEDDLNLSNASKLDLNAMAGTGEHEETLTSEKPFFMHWELPENDNCTYRLTIKAEGVTGISGFGVDCWERSGLGGDTVEETVIITRDADGENDSIQYPNGFMTIVNNGSESTTVTWELEIISGEAVPYITVEGTPVAQHAFSVADPSGCTVTVHYTDGSTADVTDKVTVIPSQTDDQYHDGKYFWDSPFRYDESSKQWVYDNTDRWLIFSYTEEDYTMNAISSSFKLLGKLDGNTHDTCYTIPNSYGEYESFNVTGYKKVVEPLYFGADGELSCGYMIEGASAGRDAWAVFSYADYTAGNTLTLEKLSSYMEDAGVHLEGDPDRQLPYYGLHEGNNGEAAVFSWSMNGKGKVDEENGGTEYVLVFGTLKNDITPEKGIAMTDFKDGSTRTFFVKLVNPE